MKVFLTDQKNKFAFHLERLKKCNIIPYKKELLNHKIKSEKITSYSAFSKLNVEGFFSYNIFPPLILKAYPQWLYEKRAMQVNDTIVQQIQIPPFRMLSQKIIVGVRIKEIYDSRSCKGFSYETLKGHMEKGVSTFKIQYEKDNFTFSIETYSAPATPVLKLFTFFSSLYQDYCTVKALKHTKMILLNNFPVSER